MSPLPRCEIIQKAENASGIYWGIGPTVTVKDVPGQPLKKRFVCLTDRTNACDHITALRRYLRISSSEEVAVA